MKRPAEPELRAIAGRARQLLRELQERGVTVDPGTPKTTAQRRVVRLPLAEATAQKNPVTLSPSKGEKERLLEPLRQKALECRDCRLCKTRNRVAFGEGSLDAPVVFVGEGPGREEDLQGRPFVGAAGQLLTKIIQAMKLQREEVYITNVVKCRPPENRPPEPDEAAACSQYLKPQLETIRPRVICALGRTAAAALLETDAPMSALRGKEWAWGGIPLIVTYHPAYLLRNPSAKKLVWEDMQQVMALLK